MRLKGEQVFWGLVVTGAGLLALHAPSARPGGVLAAPSTLPAPPSPQAALVTAWEPRRDPLPPALGGLSPEPRALAVPPAAAGAYPPPPRPVRVRPSSLSEQPR